LQAAKNGCSRGGSGALSAGTDGKSVSAGATLFVEGKCYEETSRNDRGTSIVMGYVCMGTCIRWFPADHSCQIHHCNKGTPADRCNEYHPQCKGLCEGHVL
jgi:hypothetical protein